MSVFLYLCTELSNCCPSFCVYVCCSFFLSSLFLSLLLSLFASFRPLFQILLGVFFGSLGQVLFRCRLPCYSAYKIGVVCFCLIPYLSMFFDPLDSFL